MTKNELAHLVLTPEELKNIDYGIPRRFIEDYRSLLNIDPAPFYVWCYLDSVFGYPINLAERFYMIYKNAQLLWNDTQSMISDIRIREEHLNDKGKMHDGFLSVCHALDLITLDRREATSKNSLTPE